MKNELNQIKDEWIKIAARSGCSDKELIQYLRQGGLNYIQAEYIVSIRNK